VVRSLYQQTNARLAGVDVQAHWKMSEQWQHDFALAEWTRHYKQGIFDRYPAIEFDNKIQFSGMV
jgi:iron complex outermembrane receptor protein